MRQRRRAVKNRPELEIISITSIIYQEFTQRGRDAAKRNSCVTQHLCNSNRDFQKMQQLSWKNFPVKIEKSLCKLFGPKYAQNPVHNSVTIYSVKALSVFLCIKGSFATPAASDFLLLSKESYQRKPLRPTV